MQSVYNDKQVSVSSDVNNCTMAFRERNVDEDTILLVNGYIRRIQNLLLFMVIPNEIIDECIAFLHVLVWDLSAFNQENSSILRAPIDLVNNWTTIPLNQTITNKICDIFEIEVTQIACDIEDISSNACFIGFIKDSIDDLDKSRALTLNGGIGIKVFNKQIFAYNMGKPDLPRGREVVKTLSKYFSKGDALKMIINFKENNCSWYMNASKDAVATIAIAEDDVIFPAFSPFWYKNHYEITNYSFK